MAAVVLKRTLQCLNYTCIPFARNFPFLLKLRKKVIDIVIPSLTPLVVCEAGIKLLKLVFSQLGGAVFTHNLVNCHISGEAGVGGLPPL